MNSIKKYFTNYWFLGAVLLLILNDFILKQAFHNWFTGKLSDFVGLFFFPIFFAAFFKSKAKEIFIATALFFIFFKSSFSALFINLFNTIAPFNITRVIDYTDLIALSILPFSYFIFKNADNLKQVKLTPVLPILLASFAMMSTSKEEGYLALDETFEINKSKEDLITHINTIDSQLNANTTSINIADSIQLESVPISLFISDDDLCESANIDGSIRAIDSSKCKIIFNQAIQSCSTGKRCPPLQNCVTTNTKEEMLMVIKSNFIDLL